MDMNPSAFARMGNDPLEITESILSLTTLASQLASPDLWIGVVAGAAMILAAIYFRRKRVEAFA
jgi:hypothetical protein